MKQVIDTHKLPYRNARLKAYSLDDGTTQIKFFNWNGTDVPADGDGFNQVLSNERGFLFKTDRTPIQCLTVKQSAIIKCSLDNGHSWPIEWVVHVDANALTAIDFINSNLKWIDENGDEHTYNPLIPGEQWLPDWIFRNEIDLDNSWCETALAIQATEPSEDIDIDKWVSTIFVSSTAPTNEIVFITNSPYNRLRAGQKIYLHLYQACKFIVGTGVTYNGEAGDTYLLFSSPTSQGVVVAALKTGDLLKRINEDTVVTKDKLVFNTDGTKAHLIQGTQRLAPMRYMIAAPDCCGFAATVPVTYVTKQFADASEFDLVGKIYTSKYTISKGQNLPLRISIPYNILFEALADDSYNVIFKLPSFAYLGVIEPFNIKMTGVNNTQAKTIQFFIKLDGYQPTYLFTQDVTELAAGEDMDVWFFINRMNDRLLATRLNTEKLVIE